MSDVLRDLARAKAVFQLRAIDRFFQGPFAADLHDLASGKSSTCQRTNAIRLMMRERK